MVLNWKMWEKDMIGDAEWTEYYRELWEEACKFVFDHFSGDDLRYYYRTTD